MAVHSKINGSDPAVERDPFEFCSFFGFPDSPPALCAADDIFLAGRILPFGAPPPKRYQISEGELCRRGLLRVDHPTTRCTADDLFLSGKLLTFEAPPFKQPHLTDSEIRAQDFPDADSLRRFWGGAQSKARYRRLRKVSDCDGNGLEKPTSARPQKEPLRPRWFLFLLGTMRVPETMDMGSIRNRQRRRRSRTAEPGGDVGRGTWRLLRSLSCRQLESGAVVTTPPLSFASRVKGLRSDR